MLNLVKETDFLVLARYMQALSGDFLRSYGNDIINIHHGLLPSFKGGYPSKQAFDAGFKLISATSHFVTQELDEGPIIEQMFLCNGLWDSTHKEAGVLRRHGQCKEQRSKFQCARKFEWTQLKTNIITFFFSTFELFLCE